MTIQNQIDENDERNINKEMFFKCKSVFFESNINHSKIKNKIFNLYKI